MIFANVNVQCPISCQLHTAIETKVGFSPLPSPLVSSTNSLLSISPVSTGSPRSMIELFVYCYQCDKDIEGDSIVIKCPCGIDLHEGCVVAHSSFCLTPASPVSSLGNINRIVTPTITSPSCPLFQPSVTPSNKLELLKPSHLSVMKSSSPPFKTPLPPFFS